MDSTTEQGISLLETFETEWLKLPLAAMEDCGSASQTLSALMWLTRKNPESFNKYETIGEVVGLPRGTVKEHLHKLSKLGWIDNKGRQRAGTAKGYLRRTATITLTEKAKLAAKGRFGVLPSWACLKIAGLPDKVDRNGKTKKCSTLSWSERALLAVMMGEIRKFSKGLEDQGIDFEDGWPNYMDDRFASGKLGPKTGLSREAIFQAKHRLEQLGIVTLEKGKFGRTCLTPNFDLQVVITVLPDGMSVVKFDF